MSGTCFDKSVLSGARRAAHDSPCTTVTFSVTHIAAHSFHCEPLFRKMTLMPLAQALNFMKK